MLELARILAGWPRLGAEMDEKTIPQEVRFDDIGGVSYTKGCYTGQETVARLHFRGHPNRQLRGLLFDAEPPATPAQGWSAVTHLDRDVGRVTSLAFVPEPGVSGAGRWIGLAVIRREVAPGAMVRAAGRDARVVDLPFAFPVAAPAWRYSSPAPGSPQTKSPGASPGHRHWLRKNALRPSSSSASPPPAWREPPFSSPCRPSSCASTCRPYASSRCRSSASWRGRCQHRQPRRASAPPSDTRPSPPRRGPLRDASSRLLS